jgi:peroxiredoxin family protein
VPEARGLELLLVSGTFERAHYALAMASAAAALDRPVTLFVTLAGARAFLAPDEHGRPAWANLPVAPGLAGPEAADGAQLDASYRAHGVAGFEELLEACLALGVEFMVCEMGLRALRLEAAKLRKDLPFRPGGLASLLAQGGQLAVL